ncbi:hypothetical protein Tco_1438535 [Tanacetum coccineum]
MASMNTRLNIEKLDGNIVQKHGGSKQVGFKQLGPGVETGVHGVHDEKRVWFEVELQGAQGDREAEVFQVSNDDTAVAQRQLEDKQPEEKTNTDCLVKEQKKEYQTGSPSSLIRFKTPRDMLGFFGWLASKRQGILEPVKVKCIFLGYRKGVVGNKALKVLQGVEFEVEPQEDHTFEVEPHANVDHVAGLQEVQTQDLIYYHPVLTAVDKIYAHESLTFNNTIACEVISKWKGGLEDNMDGRSDVYVLSNGCKKCSDDSDGYYWEYTPVEILATKGLLDKAKRNEVGTNFVGGTLHTVVGGSLSGDCDEEKNGKWSCIYAVGSQEYQMVCTRLDIASEDVGMLDMFDRGLQTDVAYKTLTKAGNEAIWLKGLPIESGFVLKIVACIAIGALSKAIPGLRFQHRSKLLRIGQYLRDKVAPLLLTNLDTEIELLEQVSDTPNDFDFEEMTGAIERVKLMLEEYNNAQEQCQLHHS